MKQLYLDCGMGAAGDMLMAALYEVLPDKDAFLAQMRSCGILGLALDPIPAKSCGIAGTQMSVKICGHEEEDCHHGHHAHCHGMSPANIYELLDTLTVSASVRTRAKRVYARIAEAEAKVHGVAADHIHFHELGSLDAVADVVGVCLALEMLGVERVTASPVRLGCGSVHCAHGILPVPAPATAELLLGIPSYAGEIRGEMCTPTGAALLAEITDTFGSQPDFSMTAIGYGLGKRDFGTPNCLRAIVGESAGGQRGTITELVCNLDDMSPEALSFAQTALLREGALDVYILPGLMKKGRPGYELTVLCAAEDEERLARAVFKHTTTIGMRVRHCGKYFLTPRTAVRETEYGSLQVKTAEGWGVYREKPEFDSAAELARENGVSVLEINRAFENSKK